MHKTIKLALVLGVVALIAGGISGYYVYNKPHQDVASAEPFLAMTAGELYDRVPDMESNVATYNDQVLQVEGSLNNLDIKGDTSITLILTLGEDPSNNIVCSVDPAFAGKCKGLKNGDNVVIKGVFGGVNRTVDDDLGLNMVDLQLSRCVVVE